MIHVLGATLLAFVLSVTVPYAMSGSWPDRYTMAALARFALFVGALALGLSLGAQLMAPPLSTWGPWAAALGLAVLVVVTSRAMLGQRRIGEIRRGLDDPARFERALADLEAMRRGLAEGAPTDIDRMNVASLLIHAGKPVEAIAVLAPKKSKQGARDEVARRDPVVDALCDTIEAAALVQLERRDEARRALARIARPTASAVEISVLLLEALLDALEDEPARALERIDALDPKKSRELAQYIGVVRAHAFAAQKREDEARALLKTLRAATTPLVLEKVVAHRGPASRIAKKLLEGERPYR